MKKIILISCIFFTVTANSVHAQVVPLKTKPLIKKTSPGLIAESTRTAPAPAPVTNADYLLSSATATIKTGSDNKEALSNVNIELSVRDTSFSLFAQNNLTNEFKVNSSNTIGMDKSYAYNDWFRGPTPPPGSIADLSGSVDGYFFTNSSHRSISLSDIEKYGLSLRIVYKPNFWADAWKIEDVSITLEFRDTAGNLHPTSGQKTITFTNTSTFLDNFDKRILICTADNYFRPLTSFVTKDFSKRW